MGRQHNIIFQCKLCVVFRIRFKKPLIMSFCTQGLPGVAESTVSISEGTPFSWGEGARQGG